MSWRKFVVLNLLTLIIISFIFLALYSSRLDKASLANPNSPILMREPKIVPGTKLGPLDLSGLTVPEAESLITTYINRKTYINFPHRSFIVSYEDLGVVFNLSLLGNYARRCFFNHSTCRRDLPRGELGDLLVILNEAKFDEFVASLNSQVGVLLLSPDISFDDLTLRAHDPEAKLEIDKESLLSQLEADRIFSDEEISISTVLVDPGNADRQRQATQDLVNKAVAQPLLIKYGRQPVDIEGSTISSFINLQQISGEIVAAVSEEAIERYLAGLNQKYSLDVELEKGAGSLSIAYALLFRAGGENPKTAVILPQTGGPDTDGSYAPKYLELNKTQQRLYAFENGKLIKTYIVGTGLTWETPGGNFEILKKSGTAISYTGSWYMPYYMPIGTVYGYFFGFHEIPYRLNARGQITSRDVNTMGSPATGGCIQLYRRDAKELYEWADIGTPVIIHD